MRNLFLILLTIALTIACFNVEAGDTDAKTSFKVYLIRHAEKVPDGSRDPVLTEVGMKRSEQLATWFKDKDLIDIWSSDYHRTRDTAAPLLEQSGLELRLYDTGDQPALVEQLFDRQQNALVVGHSNTIPALARLLCGCTVTDMDHTEHDRLIVVMVVDGATMVRTLQQSLLFQQ